MSLSSTYYSNGRKYYFDRYFSDYSTAIRYAHGHKRYGRRFQILKSERGYVVYLTKRR